MNLQPEEGGRLASWFISARWSGDVFLRAKSNPSLIMYVLDPSTRYSSCVRDRRYSVSPRRVVLDFPIIPDCREELCKRSCGSAGQRRTCGRRKDDLPWRNCMFIHLRAVSCIPIKVCVNFKGLRWQKNVAAKLQDTVREQVSFVQS